MTARITALATNLATGLVRTPPAPDLPETLPPGPPPLPPAGDYYLSRELTWLNFAWRIAGEAVDRRNPLLERLKFVAIVGSALDEFVMKRIGGLKTQVGAGVTDKTVDGRTPSEQIRQCQAALRDLDAYTHKVLVELQLELAEHRIEIVPWTELDPAEQRQLRDHYVENIFPLVTPQAMDSAHPFPFVSNLSLNLLVTLHYPEEHRDLLARVKVPVGVDIPRLLQLRGTMRFTPLEDVMQHNLDLLFPGMKVAACAPFRVTRNAVTEGNEDQADDLLAMIESELRERKFAAIVRVECGPQMRAEQRKLLASEFNLNEQADVFEKDGMLGVADLLSLYQLDLPELKYPAHRPIDNPALPTDRSIFRAIRDAESILLHHPYESFGTSVQRFLKEAAADPRVRAIKMTLYRTSQDSEVIAQLVNAARNGKQVAVVVELKARFDEAANIRWANRLEEVGIHVSYGVVGLKTHCKVILVVRQDRAQLRRYTHIGTGNYHAGNARGYADFGVLTCDEKIGRDITELFNYLTTGYRPERNYGRILPAPIRLKSAIIALIEREADIQREGGQGLIQLKINALEDAEITRALYLASQAGVRIDLIVRDTCRLRPGVPGLSETVHVRSILGRFLEHARVYYFRGGGEETYLLGSADMMKRNLESRVEVVVPVTLPKLRAALRRSLDLQLADTRSAWIMEPDGSYVRSMSEGPGCQQLLIDDAEARVKAADAIRKRPPRRGTGAR
ncbi:MAG: polyphosphate kinase 1 [Nannocystaceae bacterium]|nr:polyphosphate kinase 1 [Nannocystaceae bacterium]